MAECVSQKLVGRDVVLQFAIACGDVLPADADFQRLGAMRTKEFTLEWETADATADDSIGALRENLATFQTLSVSGDGTVKVSGTGAQSIKDITKHVAAPVATGGQPFAWLRLTFPDLTFTFFALITNMSRSAPFDDLVTYSIEASATSSDFGLIIEDTPNPDAVAATSVVVAPDALAIVVGQTFNVEAIALPSAADQSIVWTSSAPAVATVNIATGLVTGVTAGSAVITAKSKLTPAITETVAVTVT